VERLRRWLSPLPTAIRRVIILVIGLSIVAVGVLLLVLPGPGILVIILGLAVLAIEFTWAERLLVTARERAARAINKVRKPKNSSAG
jgi:tellurite resistance protein TerC